MSRFPKAKKSLGQNFLRDKNIIKKIIDAADIKSDETVLEVGPGQCAITIELAKRAKKVIAVEKDRELQSTIDEKLKDVSNVEVVYDDILTTQLPKDLYRVIANIPYYLTSPLLTRFLQSENRPTSLLLMVQKEIADKIVSDKGNILSMLVQMYGKAKKLFIVKPSAFYPPPKVDSAILFIELNDKPEVENHIELFDFIKKCFSGKRKQLKNALKNNLHLKTDEVEELLSKAEIDSKLRAEDLKLEDWLTLYKLKHVLSS